MTTDQDFKKILISYKSQITDLAVYSWKIIDSKISFLCLESLSNKIPQRICYLKRCFWAGVNTERFKSFCSVISDT